MNKAALKRLDALKARLVPDPCYCLVRLPDGSEAERTMDEWYDHRHEWKWLRMTRGGNETDVLLLLAAIDNYIAEDAMNRGETGKAAELTREAAHYLTEYRRRARS